MSGAALLTLTATGVGMAVSYTIALIRESKKGGGYRTSRMIAMSAAIMAAMYGMANIMVFAAMWLHANIGESGAKTPYAGAAAHFGLQPGEEYPLALGSRFAGSSGRISSDSGLFYTHTEGSWNPATAVSLGFENSSGQSWILEIPVSRITFIQDAGAKPSVVVNLNGSSYGPDFETTIDHGGCRLKIEWGWWLCATGEPTVTLSVSDDAERAGLAPIVAQAFSDGGSSATITLTPEQYDALLKN